MERIRGVGNMGDRLKYCRRQYGWTQRDLAQVSGVGLATVRRIEQDEFSPRLDTVDRLAGTLKVRKGWLAFGELPMLDPWHMTANEQYRVQAGASAERPSHEDDLSNGPWYQDGDTWRTDRSLTKEQR